MLDMSACAADKRAASGLQAATLSEAHTAFLAQRKILKSARRIGCRTITALRDNRPVSVISIPYAMGMHKSYAVGHDDKWRQHKPGNTRLPLFNFDNVDFREPWILTEGEFDALACMECDFPNVASLPDGAVQPAEEAPAQSGKLWSIKDAWEHIQAGGGPVTLALDNDAPGEATRDALIPIFGRWRCRLVEWPKHPKATGLRGRCKDANEVLMLMGEDQLGYVLESAKPIKLEGVFKPSEIKRRPPRRYYSTGLPGMDEHLKLFPGELCVWTGHTSHGKSTSILNVLGHLAQSGLKIGLASFEGDYWEDILPFYNIWLHGEQASEATEAETHAWLDKHFVFISHEIEPLSKSATIEWFIQQGQDAKGRYGIDVLVGDPWNKLQHKRGKYENETDYVLRALTELRNFAQTYTVICIMLVHPTKDSGGEVPTEFDIHGSVHWGNVADHVVITYRPNKALQSTLIRVAKSRFRKGGRPGDVWYTFSEATNRYSLHAEHLIPKLDGDSNNKRKRRD